MENNSQKSLLELAVEYLTKVGAPTSINEIIAKVLEAKGIDDPKGDKRAQLYVDITTSSKFVYMGDGAWDLKANQSLDEYDKDGVDFKGVADEDDEDGVSAADYETEEGVSDSDDEDDDASMDDDMEAYDGKNPYADSDEMESDDTDESEFDDIRDTPDQDDFDEDKYMDTMDSYEDLYDK